MGLLDDAIREHLELKRRRGADPGMVAREERDALAPVFPEEGEDPTDGDPPEANASQDAVGAPVDDPHAEFVELSAVGQETAELDMQAVMDEEADASGAPTAGAPVDGPQAADGHAPASPDDPSLEWEGSTEAGPEPVPEDVPGQERLSFE
jgi:hypothetical protein